MTGQKNNNDFPIQRDDYLQLVEWSDKVIRTDKRGVIPENLQSVLQ